jgi:hypothetical protein
MGIAANSFTLRGESGIVRISSESPLRPGSGPDAGAVECDVVVESDGFRADRALSLELGALRAFLGELRELLSRRAGLATFRGGSGGLSITSAVEGEELWVECDMDDRAEGKKNSIRVKYPIEPAYLEELASLIDGAREPSFKSA